jgi:hypothetical protein
MSPMVPLRRALPLELDLEVAFFFLSAMGKGDLQCYREWHELG